MVANFWISRKLRLGSRNPPRHDAALYLFASIARNATPSITSVSSPLPSAPPLRDLRLKYPVADLQRPLIDGIYPVMPRFRLEPHQVEAVMEYLKTLEP